MNFEKLLKDIEEIDRAERRLLEDFSWSICDWIFTYLYHHPELRAERICDFLYTHALDELIAAACKLMEIPQTESCIAKMKATIVSNVDKISPTRAERYAPTVKWAVSLLKEFEKEK